MLAQPIFSTPLKEYRNPLLSCSACSSCLFFTSVRFMFTEFLSASFLLIFPGKGNTSILTVAGTLSRLFQNTLSVHWWGCRGNKRNRSLKVSKAAIWLLPTQSLLIVPTVFRTSSRCRAGQLAAWEVTDMIRQIGLHRGGARERAQPGFYFLSNPWSSR